MKKIIFFAVVLPILIMTPAPRAVFGQQNTEVNYTNALAKYRDGDHEGALNAVRAYISLDPDNTTKKQVAVKLLLEMAENCHLENKDAQALAFLKEARSHEDNKRVNELYRTVQESLNTPQRANAAQAAAPVEAAPRDEFSMSAWLSRPETARPEAAPSGIKKPENPGPPTVKAKNPPRAPAIAPPPKASVVPQTTAGAGTGPAPGLPQTAAPPITAAAPAGSVRILLIIAAMVSGLIISLAGAAFFYLRRLQQRLLRESSMKIQEAWQKLQEEETRIREEQERMAKALGEKIDRERERIDADERRRQEAWESKEKARLEAWERAEKERLRSASDGEKERTPAPGGEKTAKEEKAPAKELKAAEEISEKLLIIDAQETARELTYKNLASRLLAYKRFASQLKSIHELNKENAIESIKPLLNDPDPNVRVYLAGTLSRLPIPEFAAVLLQLWKDSDENVRRESLRGIHNLCQRSDFTGIFSGELRTRLQQVVEEEKNRTEWIF